MAHHTQQTAGKSSAHEEYVRAAMAHARYEWMPNDRVFYAEIPEVRGVWARASTREACADELAEVLLDWIAVSLKRGRVVPVIDGIDVRA
jgi:predicted RNase H-like HicB family nuclease